MPTPSPATTCVGLRADGTDAKWTSAVASSQRSEARDEKLRQVNVLQPLEQARALIGDTFTGAVAGGCVGLGGVVAPRCFLFDGKVVAILDSGFFFGDYDPSCFLF